MRQHKHQKQSERSVHKRRLVTLLSTLGAVTVVGTTAITHTHIQLNHQQAVVQTTRKQLDRTEAQKKTLKVQVDQLKDPGYLAKLVREKYLVSKPNETVFVLPKTDLDQSK